MALLTMSERELSRLKIIEDIEARRLSVLQGAELADISRRQMTRLVRLFRMNGAAGLISKKRGIPSNRTYTTGFRDYVLALIRQHYPDFGPTFAFEKLQVGRIRTPGLSRTWSASRNATAYSQGQRR